MSASTAGTVTETSGASIGPEPDSQVRTIELSGPDDVDGFKSAARSLVANGVAPGNVAWRVKDGCGDSLFDGDESPATPVAVGPSRSESAVMKVPPAFVDMTESAALHRDPQRFSLLYQLLWRLQHEPGLRHDPLDPQWMQAERMAHAVRHDAHKMKAFVRFRRIDDGGELPLHVAFFEPEHHIVEAVAPFFARRFAQMRWAILTPRRSVSWDGERLCVGEGAGRDQAPPADAGEALWLTYYAHVFNPARLKLATMQREMPRRYWKNLPEAALIQPLAAGAHERSTTMVDRAATTPARQVRRMSAAPPRAEFHLSGCAGRAVESGASRQRACRDP
jgi:DNA polymerase